MTKYKIVYDKQGCIGAFSCVALDPNNWVIGEDGKATLLKAKQEGDNYILEIDLDNEAFDKMKAAAESCPVNVIHIYDEKGKKII